MTLTRKKNIKVLFLTTVPSPYRVDFFEILGEMCELTVLFESESAFYREDGWMKTNNKNYRSRYLKGRKIRNSFIPSNLKKELFGEKYDIYVISGYSTITCIISILLLKTFNIPFILSCDGAMLKSENYFKYILKKSLILSASSWLSTGKVTDQYLIHYGANEENIYFYPFTSIHQYELLNESVEVERKKELRDKLQIIEEKVVLTIGQFIHRKGIDVLLESCRDFSNEYGFYIIGGNPTSEYLDYIDKYNLTNVHFLPFKAKEEILEYYLASDLFVLPTREDIWGLVINESMACGLPVLTTDKCVAGLELIKHEYNGYIVPAENSKAITNAIYSYFNDNQNYKVMSQRCIEKIKCYTIENMANIHYKLFSTLAK